MENLHGFNLEKHRTSSEPLGKPVSEQPKEGTSTSSATSKKRKQVENACGASSNSTSTSPTLKAQRDERVGSRTGSKFHNMSVQDIIIIEICAGSARLTRAARTAGFRDLAIDHTDSRSCGVDICTFDLTGAAQLSDLLEYIRRDADRIALIWVAPPCGTASRARERPIPGFNDCPKPLRSNSKPDGVDNLKGLDKYKVEVANQLYQAVLEIAECAIQLDFCVAIENPTNSHYWNVEPTRKIRERFGEKFVTFHACAHGGSRDKSTSIWQSQHYFDSLALQCDRKHQHASWRPAIKNGVMTYPTAEEAAYPILLCERIVACVLTQVVQLGAISIQDFQQQTVLQQSTQQRRIAMGALPRGNKIKPLVAEFQKYETFFCDPQQQPKQIESKIRQLPKGARVTHRRLISGDGFRGSDDFKQLDNADSLLFKECEAVEACTVGIPAEPLDFLKRAVEAGHPRGIEVHVDDVVHKAVVENFHESPYLLARKRVQFFKKWQARAKVIEAEGDIFLKSSPEHARAILKGKRLQLWGEILKDLNYADNSLVADMANGLNLLDG